MKVRFLFLALAVVSASLGAPGCSGGGAHAPLHIELAPNLATDCGTESAPFPPDLRFFTLQICPSAGGMPCAMLTDPSGDHGGGTPLLRVGRSLDRRFSVDARIDPGTDYDVTITGYSGAETGTCAPTVLGHALGVRFGAEVSVRLYALGQWSCAGTHEGQPASVTRALHEAVLLPNHEVLLLGGIEGPRAGAVAFANPTLAQRIVEVFDPRDARFHQVTIQDEDGVDGFSRVMFEARYVSTDAMGRYEIHTYGGFDIQHAPDGGLGFDGNANVTSVSALFGPLSSMMMGNPAGFRSDAVILYDPATRSATVTAHGTSAYTTTAATEGPTSIGVVRGIDTVTVNAMTGRPSYGLAADFYVDGGRETTLMSDRLGASITNISPTSYLIWGGDVASAMDMALTDPSPTAGEVVSSTTMGSTAVAAHDATVMPDDGRPQATAYHTATHIAGPTGSTAILFAGGAVLTGGSAPLATATGTFATPSLTITRFAADGSVVGGSHTTGAATRASTVLHTATPVDASLTSVLLVGGATLMPLSGVNTTLVASASTGLVSFVPASSSYTYAALPDLMAARWGHTTTIIPNHGVLVVGGISRTDANLNVSDSAEFLLWEDLRNMGRPTSMDCAMAADAGPAPMDAGTGDGGAARDTGPAVDANVDAARPPVDANVDANTDH